MENKIKRAVNIINIMIVTLMIGLSFYVTRCGLCSEEPNEMESLLPPMDNYAEIEAKILELSEELSYKNKMSARKTEGLVKNPGIIVGKVRVVSTYSDKPERHSENTIVYLEHVHGHSYQPVIKRHAIFVGQLCRNRSKDS